MGDCKASGRTAVTLVTPRFQIRGSRRSDEDLRHLSAGPHLGCDGRLCQALVLLCGLVGLVPLLVFLV